MNIATVKANLRKGRKGTLRLLKPGETHGVTYPEGVCIVCGSVLLIQCSRGHPGNQRIHCNDCGTEVTPLMHAKKQPHSGK